MIPANSMNPASKLNIDAPKFNETSLDKLWRPKEMPDYYDDPIDKLVSSKSDLSNEVKKKASSTEGSELNKYGELSKESVGENPQIESLQTFDPDESIDKLIKEVEPNEGLETLENSKEGLTRQEKNDIKSRTGWSDNIVDHIKTVEEAEVYEKAGLIEQEVNGKSALIQPNIEGKAYNEPKWPDWSNKDLAQDGYPPRDKNGNYYELHHIGQNPDSPLAELTYEQHHSDGNFKILHNFDESNIDRGEFKKEREEYWKARYESL